MTFKKTSLKTCPCKGFENYGSFEARGKKFCQKIIERVGLANFDPLEKTRLIIPCGCVTKYLIRPRRKITLIVPSAQKLFFLIIDMNKTGLIEFYGIK